MRKLSEKGQRIVSDVAQRHGFSFDAVATMLQALAAGYGTQAQFNHLEFGGMGQWSQGGMIMIGDMFNNNLRYRVDSLCNELSGILANSTLYEAPAPMQSQQQSQGGGSFQSQGGSYQSPGSGAFYGQGSSLFVPGPNSMNWWPSDLGSPSSTGAQNTLRYAVFPAARRLVIDNNGSMTIYDIGDLQISGFSQQQSGDQSITFNSQYGIVRVADLPIVGQVKPPQSAAPEPSYTAPSQESQQQPSTLSSVGQTQGQRERVQSDASKKVGAEPPSDTNAIFATIERLDELRKKEIITEAEFETKKAELLSRL